MRTPTHCVRILRTFGSWQPFLHKQNNKPIKVTDMVMIFGNNGDEEDEEQLSPVRNMARLSRLVS